MNNLQENVFNTLTRIETFIKSSELLNQLSHLVQIDFSVVGGAIRDLYLEKPIKDIDISINLNFYKNLKVIYPTARYKDDDADDILIREQSAEAEALDKRNKEIIAILRKPEFSIVHNLLEQKDATAIQCIVYLIQKTIELNNDYTINKVFDSNSMKTTSETIKLKEVAYENLGLFAVFSMEDKKSNYPVELLFTTDKVDNFIECFDFDICKIYMTNLDGNPNIVPSKKFLNEIQNQTITYTPDYSVTEAKMNKSLFVRYERLQKKYPEFVLTVDTSGLGTNNKDMIENTVKAVSLFHQLKETTNDSQNKKIGRPLKI